MLIAETDFLGTLPSRGLTVGSTPSERDIVAYLYTLMSPPKSGTRPKQAPAPGPRSLVLLRPMQPDSSQNVAAGIHPAISGASQK